MSECLLTDAKQAVQILEGRMPENRHKTGTPRLGISENSGVQTAKES
jgi:hypothetical protein